MYRDGTIPYQRFRAWELAGTYPALLEDKLVGESARKLYADARKMLDRIVRDCAELASRGIGSIDPVTVMGHPLSRPLDLGFITLPSVTLYYYLFLALVVAGVVICYRLENSRIGRAWMAIREDEIAAKAMGINTRNMKLLAQARIVMWEGGALWVVDATKPASKEPRRTDLHAHHAIQITMSLGGQFRLDRLKAWTHVLDQPG